jgi:hypothetical protein
VRRFLLWRDVARQVMQPAQQWAGFFVRKLPLIAIALKIV